MRFSGESWTTNLPTSTTDPAPFLSHDGARGVAGYVVTRAGSREGGEVVVRDPDGPTEVPGPDNGEPVEVAESCIDAGAGWDWDDWKEHRGDMLAGASPAAREPMLTLLDGPPAGSMSRTKPHRTKPGRRRSPRTLPPWSCSSGSEAIDGSARSKR